MSHLNSRNCTSGASSGRPPDDELILRIAQGKSGALEQLYRQTASAVYGYALSILKDATAAEDVMQDVCQRAAVRHKLSTLRQGHGVDSDDHAQSGFDAPEKI